MKIQGKYYSIDCEKLDKIVNLVFEQTVYQNMSLGETWQITKEVLLDIKKNEITCEDGLTTHQWSLNSKYSNNILSEMVLSEIENLNKKR